MPVIVDTPPHPRRACPEAPYEIVSSAWIVVDPGRPVGAYPNEELIVQAVRVGRRFSWRRFRFERTRTPLPDIRGVIFGFSWPSGRSVPWELDMELDDYWQERTWVAEGTARAAEARAEPPLVGRATPDAEVPVPEAPVWGRDGAPAPPGSALDRPRRSEG